MPNTKSFKLTEEQKKELSRDIISVSETEYEDLQNAKENMKIAINNIKDKYLLTPKMIRKLVKTYYDSTLENDKAEFEEFFKLYTTVMNEENK